MSHSDDNGLVLPPKLAPIQVVIIPIFKNDEELDAITEKINPIIIQLKKIGIRVKFDHRDTQKPGWKFNEYEFKGVPVRFAVGLRDLGNNVVEIARRDTLTKELIDIDKVVEYTNQLMNEIQMNLFQTALKRREDNTTIVNTFDEFVEVLDTKGGFVLAHWDGTSETEEKIKQETKATIRCIPLDNKLEDGICIFSGKPSTQRVVFARSY